MLNMKVQVWRGLTLLLKVKGCGGSGGGVRGNVVIVK